MATNILSTLLCPGYVPNASQADSRGKKILHESGHYAAHLHNINESEGEEDEDDASDKTGKKQYDPEADYSLKTEKAQDLHAILSVMMAPVEEFFEHGMIWDYKYRGKVYKEVKLKPFAGFVQCDGDEADKLTGHYRSRGRHVKCVCRYCVCPTADADNEHARYKMKTQEDIEKMIAKNQTEQLKRISQQNIENAFYNLQFGAHSKQGIHGACPMELLHHILLGIYKYCRDAFFMQIGKESQAAKEINALAKILGKFFARQSDRDLPKTNFAKGIFEGKIMGKEFSGVMLLIATILQTQKGKDLLMKKKAFRAEGALDDWAMLVETLLEWEAYLKLDEMKISHVKRLRRKHVYLMYLIKRVLNRTEGVGMKFMKFHGILHLVDDILAFGVPANVDTGANESHHKLTKLLAKLTQRDIKTFEGQTAKRMVEFLLLEFAMAELDGKTMWEYFVLDQERGPVRPFWEDADYEEKKARDEEDIIVTGGSNLQLALDNADNNTLKCQYKGSKREAKWGQAAMNFLFELQNTPGVPQFDIRTEHKRHGQIFRGHPNFRKNGQWCDWAIFNWGHRDGQLPGEIWAFVDFSEAPANFSVNFHQCRVQRGIYALIESTTYCDDDWPSSMFTPITKDLGNDGQPVFYLADVDSIVGTCCVVPDIGHKDHFRYFEVRPRKEWSGEFIAWLMQVHAHDEDNMSDDEDDT